MQNLINFVNTVTNIILDTLKHIFFFEFNKIHLTFLVHIYTFIAAWHINRIRISRDKIYNSVFTLAEDFEVPEFKELLEKLDKNDFI